MFLFIFIYLNYNGYSQGFQRTFGGKLKDNAFEIVSTKDKGYLTIGSTTSFGLGKSDILVLKIDSMGNLQWSKTFGGPADDFGHSIDKTPDGNYVIVGHSLTFSKEYTDICLYGLDRSDYSNMVRCTKDGGLIIVGEAINLINHEKNSDILLLRLDAEGTMMWSKIYGGNNTDYGYSVQETKDGGFIIGGETNSYGAGEFDLYFLKLNKDGVVEFSKTFGDKKSDYGRFAIQTEDGGYIMGGNTSNFGAADLDLFLVKMDARGQVEWTKTFGGGETDYLLSIKNVDSDKFAITGYTNSFHLTVENAFFLIITYKGKVHMGKSFGGHTHDYGVAMDISKEDVVICGSTQSFGVSDDDIYLVKTKMKWKVEECNQGGMYPLNMKTVVSKAGTGHYEFELHCPATSVEMASSNAVIAEQVLCVMEDEK